MQEYWWHRKIKVVSCDPDRKNWVLVDLKGSLITFKIKGFQLSNKVEKQKTLMLCYIMHTS